MTHAAKEFFIDKWNDQKHLFHCQAVIDACLGMAKQTNLNPDIFIVAGWIHDMGKLVDKKTHHLKYHDFLDRFLKLHPEFNSLKAVLVDCIEQHRTGGEPVTLEGRIFQLADKVSLRDVNWLEYKKNC